MSADIATNIFIEITEAVAERLGIHPLITLLILLALIIIIPICLGIAVADQRNDGKKYKTSLVITSMVLVSIAPYHFLVFILVFLVNIGFFDKQTNPNHVPPTIKNWPQLPGSPQQSPPQSSALSAQDQKQQTSPPGP